MSLRSNGSQQLEQGTALNAQPPFWGDNFDSNQQVHGVTESKTQFGDSELFRQNNEPTNEGFSFNNFNSVDRTSQKPDSEYSGSGQQPFDMFADYQTGFANQAANHAETPVQGAFQNGNWDSFTPVNKEINEANDSAFVKNLASGDTGHPPPHEVLNDMPPEVVQADTFGFEPSGVHYSQSRSSDAGMHTQQSLGVMQVEGSYDNHFDMVQSTPKNLPENAIQPQEEPFFDSPNDNLPVDRHPEHEQRPSRLSNAEFTEPQEQMGEQRLSLRQKNKSLASSNMKSLVSSVTDLGTNSQPHDPHSTLEHPQISPNLTESLVDSKHGEPTMGYSVSDPDNGQTAHVKSRTSLGDSGIHQSIARVEEELRKSAAERSKTPERLASQNLKSITDQAIGDIIRDSLTQQHIDSLSASVKESEYGLYMESKASLYSHGVNFMDLNRKPTAGSLDSTSSPQIQGLKANNYDTNSQFMKINKNDEIEAKTSQGGLAGDGTARLSRNGSKKVSFAKDMIVSYDPTESASATIQRESVSGGVSPAKQIIERPIRQQNESIAVLIPRTIDEVSMDKELQRTGDSVLVKQSMSPTAEVRQSNNSTAKAQTHNNAPEGIAQNVHISDEEQLDSKPIDQINHNMNAVFSQSSPKLNEVNLSDKQLQTPQKSISNYSHQDSKVAFPNHVQNIDKLEEQAVQHSEQPSSQQDSLDVEAVDAEIDIPNDIHRKSTQRSSKIESGKNLLPDKVIPQQPERLSEKKVAVPENEENAVENVKDMIAPFKARASNFQATIAKRLSNLEAEAASPTEVRRSSDFKKLLIPKYIDEKQTLDSENSIKSPIEIKKTISDMSYGNSGGQSPNTQPSPADKWKTLEPNLFKVAMSDNQLASAGASPVQTYEASFGGKVSDAQVKANQAQTVKVPFKKQSLANKDGEEKVILIADVEEVIRSPVKVQQTLSPRFAHQASPLQTEAAPGKSISVSNNPSFLAQYSSNPVVRAAQPSSINPQQTIKSTRVQNCLFSNFYENMYQSPVDVSQVSINGQTTPSVSFGQTQTGQHGKVYVQSHSGQQTQNQQNMNALQTNPPVMTKHTIVHSQPQVPSQNTGLTEHWADYSGSRSPERQTTNSPRFMNAYLGPPNIQKLQQPQHLKAESVPSGTSTVKVYSSKPIGSEMDQSFSINYGSSQPGVYITKTVSSGPSKSPELQTFKSGTVYRTVNTSPQPQPTIAIESFLASQQKLTNSAVEQQFKERSISPYRTSQVKVQALPQAQQPQIKLYKDTMSTNTPSTTIYQPGVTIHQTVRQNSPSSYQYVQSNSGAYIAAPSQIKSPTIQPQSTAFKVNSEPPLQPRIINSASSIPQNQTYQIPSTSAYQTTFINSSRSPSRQGSQISNITQQPIHIYNSAGITDAQKTVWLNAPTPRTVQQPVSNFKVTK